MEQIQSISINSNWFYHHITPETFRGIIERKGILSKRNLLRLKKFKIYKTSVFNGYDYISLTKKQDVSLSSYNYFCIDSYSLIIDTKRAHKTHYINKDIRVKNINISDILSSLPIPIRFSGWHDEYQVKNIVPLKNIIGIKLPEISSKFYVDYDISDFVSIMEDTNFILPFIDIENQKSIPYTKMKEYMLEMNKLQNQQIK